MHDHCVTTQPDQWFWRRMSKGGNTLSEPLLCDRQQPTPDLHSLRLALNTITRCELGSKSGSGPEQWLHAQRQGQEESAAGNAAALFYFGLPPHPALPLRRRCCHFSKGTDGPNAVVLCKAGLGLQWSLGARRSQDGAVRETLPRCP